MPLVYRSRSESQPLPTPSSSTVPTTSPISLTDADDSIVLSDLLRSGEASRLRRRGAIFIRDPSGSASASSSSSAPPALPRMPSPSSTRRAPPLVSLPASGYSDDEDDDDEDDDADEYGPEWGFGPLGGTASSADLMERDARRLDLEAEMRLEDADQAAGSFALYCGGPPEDVVMDDAASSRPRRKPSAFVKPARHTPVRRSNGCGALIHLSAIPRRKYGVWIARGDATKALAPLDAEYFDCRAVAKMLRSTCGCVREGVGCRYCGNSLGTIFTPCPAAAAGLFSSSPSPSPSPAPPGSSSSASAFQLPRSSRPSSVPPSPPSTSVFTFFAHSVRSTPAYTFPDLPPMPTLESSASPQPLPRRRWPTYTASRRWGVGLSEREENDNPDGEDSDEEELETVRDVALNDSQEKIEAPIAVWAER